MKKRELVLIKGDEVIESWDVTGETDLDIVKREDDIWKQYDIKAHKLSVRDVEMSELKTITFLPFTNFAYSRLTSGDCKISFKTDQLTPDKLVRVDSMFNTSGIVAIRNANSISEKEIKSLEKLDPDEFGGKAKSQSQRIRDHLFRLWKYDDCGYAEFKEYYKYKTEIFLVGLRDEMKKYDD